MKNLFLFFIGISHLINSQEIENVDIKQLYIVTAKNGLIMREEPKISSRRILKFPYNSNILIHEKTNIPLVIVDDGKEIKGFWYKIAINNSITLKDDYGYVFSGFLKPLKLINNLLVNSNSSISYSRTGITFNLNGICSYEFPVRVNKKFETVELVWTNHSKCFDDIGLQNTFRLDNVPVLGQPFAKIYMEDRVFKIDYYYKEWISKYSEIINKDVFLNEYYESK
ncbi:SH3 domain-containing protein [Aquimarina aquimarini]|uniref:SH3 domain-containing protein n=1 Tax=Aquimarina aquimarini TaxID=1191734 RepID=UPI000D552C18|nr:SH3 domain-containing protein [Aquimarina aquimarini]